MNRFAFHSLLAMLARPVALSLVLAGVGVLGGCPPPPNFLDGSVKTAHDLDFDSSELRFLSDQKAYQLSYFKQLDKNNAAGGVDTIVKITFNEPVGGVKVDKEINLLDEAIQGKVERITAKNDPFPTTLRKGEVTFHTEATVGKTVAGEFAITFDNGETLDGAFEVKLTSVSF